MRSLYLGLGLLLTLNRQVLYWPVDGLQQSLGSAGKDGDADRLKTCLQCPPGTFASKPCYSGSQTLCEACPPSTFSDTFNLQASCRPCSRCQWGLVKGCSPTTDTVCSARIHRRSEDSQTQPNIAEDHKSSPADGVVTHTAPHEADEGEKNGEAQERDAAEGEHHAAEGDTDATEGEHDVGTKNKANDGETQAETKNDDPAQDDGETKKGASDGDSTKANPDGETKSGTKDGDSTEADAQTKGAKDGTTSEVKQDGDVKDDVTKKIDGGDEKGETIDGASDGDTMNGASDGDTMNGASDGDTMNGASDGESKNGASDGDATNGASDGESTNGASDGDSKNGASDGHTINGASDGDTMNGASDGDSKNGASDGDSKNGASDGESKNGASDGESKNGASDGHTINGASDGDAMNAASDGESKNEGHDEKNKNGDTENEANNRETMTRASDGDTMNGASDGDSKNGASDGDSKNGVTEGDMMNGASDGDTMNGANDGDTVNGASDGDSKNGGHDEKDKNGDIENGDTSDRDTMTGASDGDTMNGASGGDSKNEGHDGKTKNVASDDDTNSNTPSSDDVGDFLKTVRQETSSNPISAENGTALTDTHLSADESAPGREDTAAQLESHPDTSNQHDKVDYGITATLSLKETEADSPGDESHSHGHHNQTTKVDSPNKLNAGKALQHEDAETFPSSHSLVTPVGQMASPREEMQHEEEKGGEDKAEEELQEFTATTAAFVVKTEAVDATGNTEEAHKDDSDDFSEDKDDEKPDDNTEDAQHEEQSQVTKGMSDVDNANKPSGFTELQNRVDYVATTLQTELQGDTSDHTQDTVHIDLTLAEQEMAEGLMENKEHTENWQQNVTMARGSIPGAVLWRSYAPSSVDSGINNITDEDSATSLSDVITPVIPALEGHESTNITSDDNQFSDFVSVANQNANVTGADGGVLVIGHAQSAEVNTEHSTTVPFTNDTLLSPDEEEREGDGGEHAGTTELSFINTDQGLHAGIDTNWSDSGISLATNASTDPAISTQQPESIATDDVLNNTNHGPHLEHDLVITSPADSLPEQSVIHSDGETGNTSHHMNNKSDINLLSNASESSSDEKVIDSTREPFIHEGIDLSANVTHMDENGQDVESHTKTDTSSATTDEPEGQHHINIVHFTTHSTTQRIPTIEEFESTLQPEGNILDMGSGDTGFTLGLDPSSNVSHIDPQHKGEEDVVIDKVDGPKDDAATGSETEEATRKPPGRPQDNVKAGHVIPWDTDHLFITTTEEDDDDIIENDSRVISGSAKQGGDTEDDASSKQRTAIIVGVAIGGVALFALGFFASRKCKRRGEFKPAPREDGEANGTDEIEFRPLKGGSSGASGVYDEVMEGGHPTRQTGRFSYRQVSSEGYSPVATSEPTSSDPGHPPMESFAPPVEDDTYAVVNKQLKSNPSVNVKPEPGISEIDKIRYIDETTDDEGAEPTPHDRLLPPRQRHHAALPEVETEEDEEGVPPPPLPAHQPPSVSPKSTSLGKGDMGSAQARSTSSDSMASLGNDVMQKLDSKMTNGTKKGRSQRSLEGYAEAEGSGADDLSKGGSIVNGDRAPIIMRNGV